MAGFWSGLFGRGNGSNSGEAFFLNEDDAKTFGNIDYMRSSKVVKRTFARKRGQTEELESVRQISAMDKRDVQEEKRVSRTQTFTPSTPSATSSSSPQPQFQTGGASSNDMDMFRNMAKKMRKS
ncbi:MAG: hypothetical protein ACFB0C_24925 [Leptolyngbyaceae cyanobacterium]